MRDVAGNKKYASLPAWYLAKRVRSALKGVGLIEKNKLGSAVPQPPWEEWLTPKTGSLPTSTLVVLCQRV